MDTQYLNIYANPVIFFFVKSNLSQAKFIMNAKMTCSDTKSEEFTLYKKKFSFTSKHNPAVLVHVVF